MLTAQQDDHQCVPVPIFHGKDDLYWYRTGAFPDHDSCACFSLTSLVNFSSGLSSSATGTPAGSSSVFNPTSDSTYLQAPLGKLRYAMRKGHACPPLQLVTGSTGTCKECGATGEYPYTQISSNIFLYLLFIQPYPNACTGDTGAPLRAPRRRYRYGGGIHQKHLAWLCAVHGRHQPRATAMFDILIKMRSVRAKRSF